MSAAHTPAKGPLRQRGDVLFVAGVICGVGLLAWVVITMQSLSHSLTDANDARDQLAHQVQQLGASPVAGPPGSRGAPGQSVTGPQGPTGSPGPTGKPGASGSPGRPGPTGSPGTVGPTGDAGSPGTTGVQGPAGPAGPQGEKGDKGDPGSPPSSITIVESDGTTETCTPDSSGSTHYTCQPSGGDPPPSSPGILGLGSLAGSAMYRRLI